MFSAGRDEANASVARLFDENKQLTRRVRTLEEITARVEAEELLSEAKLLAEGVKLCSAIFDDRDAESLKKLALALIEHPKTIALLGARGERVRAVRPEAALARAVAVAIRVEARVAAVGHAVRVLVRLAVRAAAGRVVVAVGSARARAARTLRG
jgi:alanyl-tRNA synthetase